MQIKCLQCKHYKKENNIHKCSVWINIVVKGQLQDPIKEDCMDFEHNGTPVKKHLPNWIRQTIV